MNAPYLILFHDDLDDGRLGSFLIKKVTCSGDFDLKFVSSFTKPLLYGNLAVLFIYLKVFFELYSASAPL